MSEFNNKKSLVKVEGSVCEYPFFTLSKSTGKIEKKEYNFNPITLEDGRMVERTLILESSKEWGLPSSFDMDVLIAISYIATKNNTLTERIYFSLYEIAKMLGIPNKEVRIREAILKMYHVNCHSEYCVLVIDKKRKSKKYLTKKDYFHIFDNVSFIDLEQEKNNRKSKEETYVRFNEVFKQNFFSGYFQYIDFPTYIDLGNPTAKRLYTFLSKKKTGRSKFKIGITKLANVIPIEAKRLSKVRELLKKACERLEKAKIITGYELKKRAMDITFYFPDEKLKDSNIKEDQEILKLSNEKQKIYELLIEIGVTDGVVKQLIKDHPTEKIEQQLKWLKSRKMDDPPAVLVASIRDDWAPPKEVVKDKENKETQKQVESILKKANNSKYIVLPSGKKREILKVSDEVIEFIDENERRMIPTNQTFNCKFED